MSSAIAVHFALKTLRLGMPGNRNFGKSGVIERSLSRWASLVIVVPKKSAPNGPLRR